MNSIEDLILSNLQFRESYARKVMPFLKPDYFEQEGSKIIFEKINMYFQKYNSLPTKDAMVIEFQNDKISERTYDDVTKQLEDIYAAKDEPVNEEWMLEKTEQFCKDRSLYIALMESISISDGNDKNLSTTSIPDLLSKALSVSFDTNIGHDYFRDADKRFDHYNQKVSKLPFGLKTLNMITNGGIERKTLNAILGGTGAGKTIFLCDVAAQYIIQGFNVLYITLEMSEEKIAERIDANLLDVGIENVRGLKKDVFDDKLSRLKSRSAGSLKIKEYPTGNAHVGHFRFLLQEYKVKENFVPDVIVVDYMGIMASAKIKNKTDTYMYIKSIAEELRGLAVETNTGIWSGVQSNREAQVATDVDITNTSESMGGPFTFDFFLAIVVNEDLQKLNQAKMIQLKSRYGNKDKNRTLAIGLDKNKMRFYDLNNTSNEMVLNKNTGGNTIQDRARILGV